MRKTDFTAVPWGHFQLLLQKYRKGFEPLLPEFSFAPLNDLDKFEKAINHKTAAVLVESIQGEGESTKLMTTFSRNYPNFAPKRGVMLLLDEVQAGIRRTGEFLGFQKSGILPSAVAMAKGLGGGFPIGAIWINHHHADIFGPGSHGTTFGGSPSLLNRSCGLDVLEEEDLIFAAKKHGNFLCLKLSDLANKYPTLISEIRGRGLIAHWQSKRSYSNYLYAKRIRSFGSCCRRKCHPAFSSSEC